jgi:hypothetical protein
MVGPFENDSDRQSSGDVSAEEFLLKEIEQLGERDRYYTGRRPAPLLVAM